MIQSFEQVQTALEVKTWFCRNEGIKKLSVSDLLDHRSSHIPRGLYSHKRTVQVRKDQVGAAVSSAGEQKWNIPERVTPPPGRTSSIWAASLIIPLFIPAESAPGVRPSALPPGPFKIKAPRRAVSVSASARCVQNKTLQETLRVTYIRYSFTSNDTKRC